MDDCKVISEKNLPIRYPLILTVVTWLVLDRFHAPSWLWGATGAVFLFLWIGAIVAKYKQTQVDVTALLEQIRRSKGEKN